MNADRIIVLDDGMIKEEGSHEDLINRNGIYAEISRLQALEEELNK
jgi:ABC-type multidrug transport system fused ATPase/permease subunit